MDKYSTTAHIDFDDVYSVIKRVQLFQIFQVLCFIVVFYFSRPRSGSDMVGFSYSSIRNAFLSSSRTVLSAKYKLKVLLFGSMGRCESLFDMTACQSLVQSQFQ